MFPSRLLAVYQLANETTSNSTAPTSSEERLLSLFFATKILDLIYYAGNAVILAILLLLWLLFCREQPLRNRLLNPLLYLSCMFLYHGVQTVVNLVELVVKAATSDFSKGDEWFGLIKTIMFSWLTIVGCFCAIAFALQAIRFIAWQNLHHMQVKVMHKLANIEEHSTNIEPEQKRLSTGGLMRKSIIYRFISSRITHVFSVIFTTIILFITVGLTTGLMIGLKAERGVFNPEDGIGIVCVAVAVVITGVILLYDIIVNRKTYCKCPLPLRDFFFIKDRLLFRFDVIMFYLGYICYIVALILSLVSSALVEDPSMTAEPIAAYTISNVLFFLFFIFLDMSLGGGSCIFTIVLGKIESLCPSAVANRRSKVSADNEMKQCLEDGEGYDIFKRYVQSEFSTENLSCWTMIQKYKNMKDKAKRIKVAQDIVNTFLKSRAIMEVNTTVSIREQIIRTVTTSDSNGEIFTDEFFDKVELEVCFNLMDSYQRLVKTYEFAQYVLLKKEKEQELKKISVGIV